MIELINDDNNMKIGAGTLPDRKEPFNIIDNDTERFDCCPHCGAKMGETEWLV